MKLLYIANLRLPTEKAYGIQIAKMCEAFADYNPNTSNEDPNASNKINLKLVAPFRENKIKEDFFEYYNIDRNFEFKKIWAPDFYLPGKLDRFSVNVKSFISAALLSFYALNSGADIIYTRDEWPAYLLSFSNRKVIFEAHKFSESRKFFYERLKRIGIKIVVISEGLKKDFMSFGFLETLILVTPDGVDLEKFDINVSKEEARKKLDLPQDKKIVMYSGHLYDWKGADLLLEVARNFKFLVSNFEILYVFIGGTEYDIEKFKEKAEGLDSVLILGHKPYSQMPIFLKAADILVLPNTAGEAISKKYTSPLKLFEYMAARRPIVSSDLPSIREVLNDQNSILFQSDNPESLSKGISSMINDSVLARSVADKARQDVESYSWKKRAVLITSFYE